MHKSNLLQRVIKVIRSYNYRLLEQEGTVYFLELFPAFHYNSSLRYRYIAGFSLQSGLGSTVWDIRQAIFYDKLTRGKHARY